MLRRAGLDIHIRPGRIDEQEIAASLHADGAEPGDCALLLAELKAVRISRDHPGALVIGADQMLAQGNHWFDKPVGRAGALAQLQALRGQRHTLFSAVVVARNGVRIWHHLAEAHLTMRALSDAELERYLDRAGDAILSSVGAYHIEGLGVTLFQRIEGDSFTIMGLPLLPLLAFLREHDAAG